MNKIIIKNILHTLSTNIFSLLVSTLVIIVIPKLVSVEQYGLWQLYLFYLSYVGFLHFGWSDGIYLRYGGKSYYDLNREKFFSQIFFFTILQVFIATIIIITSNIFIGENNAERNFIFNSIAVSLVMLNVKNLLMYILQSTNRIKEYARVNFIDRFFYIVLIFLFLFIGPKTFVMIVVADLLAKLISLLLAVYYCREITFIHVKKIKFDKREIFKNIQVGINLLLANIAGLLIIGVIRFAIEQNWSLEVFAQVSLTLSISNMVMLVINAVGTIMFPMLRMIDQDKMKKVFDSLNVLLFFMLFAVLIAYYPLQWIIGMWLPEYSQSVQYMAIIFPIFVFEGKMAMIVNTYLKALRKEKQMLYFNVFSLCVSCIFVVVTAYFLKNITLTVMTIVVVLAIRSTISEYYLAKIFNQKKTFYKFWLLQLFLITIFILGNLYFSPIISAVIYISFFSIIIVLNRKSVVKALTDLLSKK